MKSTILIHLMLLLITSKETRSISDCEKYPCANNGVCNQLSTGRHCVCQLGYGGSDCLIDLCQSRPCSNGATCVQGQNARHCVCPLGFSGEDCSLEECVAHPCRNGATCIPKFLGRQCICPLGFRGADRETDICRKDPCLHEGQCIPGLSSTSCVCQIGYTGRFCETAICDPNPCVNGHNCLAKDDDYYCQCAYEGGQRCQYNDILPWGRPLLPKTYILPDATICFIYIPKKNVQAPSSSRIYGLRVVTTENPTPFYIQIWRQEGDQWRNLTLKYSKKINLSTETPIQEIKFSDLGIKCGTVGYWDKVGFFFPEGSDGIGLHDCKHDCEVFLNRDGMMKVSVGETKEFEYPTLKYSFGVKVYFALEGPHGRKVDSNSCPENTELPDEGYGDRGDIIDTKEYSFAFQSAFTAKTTLDRQKITYPENRGGIPDSVIIGAILGGLLLVAIIIIIVLALKLCRQGPSKQSSSAIDNEMFSSNDEYTIPSDNSDRSDRSYMGMDNNNYYETPRFREYMNNRA